jgi:succinate-semialdehyde dehydrogenase/glutarate-semialdehyde dehydrogenase
MAVKGAIASKFRNSGQTCVSANCIFVQSEVYETFSDRFIKAARGEMFLS